jgi:hypothetical protein
MRRIADLESQRIKNSEVRSANLWRAPKKVEKEQQGQIADNSIYNI